MEQYQKIEHGPARGTMAPYPVFLVCWLVVTSLVSIWAIQSYRDKAFQMVWVASFLYFFFFYVFANITDRALGITRHDLNNHFFLFYSLFLAGRNFFWKEKAKT